METEKTQRGNSVLAFKAGLWYTLGNFFGKAITIIGYGNLYAGRRPDPK